MEQHFKDIVLEPEQAKLLRALVEAWRNLPRDDRRKFIHVQTFSGSEIIGLSEFSNPYKGDVEALASEGLLNLHYGRNHSMNFDISPIGFRYYEYLKRNEAEFSQTIEDPITSYFDTGYFAKKHRDAFQKWSQANELLTSADTATSLTSIGHLCREAMQLFAQSLIDLHRPNDFSTDVTKTIRRIEAVLKEHNQLTSSTKEAFLIALLNYWGAVNADVQRQEHGALKENEELRWDDARRVVFHTAIVMYEIEKALG